MGIAERSAIPGSVSTRSAGLYLFPAHACPDRAEPVPYRHMRCPYGAIALHHRAIGNCARRAYARGLSWDFAIRVAVISGPTAMGAVVRAPVQVYGPRDASAACRAIRIAYLAAQQGPDLPPDGDRIEVLLPSRDAIVETEYRIP